MLETTKELFVNLLLSESQIKAWYLEQSYGMKPISFDRKALNSQLLLALSYPVYYKILSGVKSPYKDFYADDKRKNFVAIDFDDCGYLFRTELTKPEQLIVESNHKESKYGNTLTYVNADTGFESTLYPAKLSDDGPIGYMAFSKF